MNSELLLLSSSTEETMEPPETILTKREKLKVLDFKKTNISLILPMLPLLENLQTLCLENCVLGDVSMIGKLQKLLILKLSGSSIKQLPESFKNLSNLWLLDLTQCKTRQECPRGVISSLAKLQELRMRISWQDRPLMPRGFRWHDRSESFVQDEVVLELLSLCDLKTLEVDLPSIVDLDEYLQKGYKLLDGLERFQISVNILRDSGWNRDFKPSENFLKLDSDWNSLHRSSISLLLKKTDALQLSLKNLREPLNVLDGGRHLVAVLISLSLNESDALEYVIDMTTSAVNDVLFPVLVSLTMNETGSLRRICNGVPPVGSFKELRRVEVSSCAGLNSLFPLSVARELHQLEEVCIRDCSMLEEIVTFEGQAQEEKALTEMRLPSLTHLNLANLPEFVGISKNVRLIISFHLLINVKLKNLPKLISLHPNDSAPEHLFDAKDGSFLELRFIDVIGCEAIKSVFSSDSMQSLQNLESLNVMECSSLKTLFDFECLDVEGERASTLSCIDRMELIDLPQLEYIWKPHPKIQAFQKLRFLKVHSCKTLKHVFPIYVAEGLLQLESLDTSQCDSMKYIFCGNVGGGDREDETKSNKIVLSQVKDLQLEGLPSLQRFCAAPWILEFPSLRRLVLRDLSKLNTALALAVFHSPSQILNEKDVIKCNEITSVFSSDSTGSLQNLESLNVKECSSLKTLFDFECLDVEGESASSMLSCINHMELIDLPQLEYIWKPLPKIQAFQNLRFLKVRSCRTLKHVFPIYVAEGLLQLESICISRCDSLDEFLCGNDRGGDREDETTSKRIVRSQVKDLELTDLKSLQRFCAAPWIIEFPSLMRRLVLRDLYKLNTALPIAVFDSPSQILNEKVVSSNSDQNLQLEVRNCRSLERLFHFEVGLDNKQEDTIVALSCLEKMRLSHLANLEYLWEPSPKILAFQNLKSLQVASCDRLRFVFPVSTAKSLMKLESINVEFCIQMKEVLAEVDGEENEIVFPEMQSLSLVNLYNLQSFYPASRTLEWPSLIDLVLCCKRMATFVPENNSYNLAADDFYTYLFSEKVNFPSLKTLNLRSMNKIKDIWSNKLVPTTFCELVRLEVSECHKLFLLLPLYMQDRLKKLESLTVEKCESLEDIFEFRGLHSNNGNALTITQQREAPATLQLEKMKIEQTPSFQNLTSISVSYCRNLRYLLPSSLAVSLGNLKILYISYCENIEEVVLKPAEADEAEGYIVFPQLFRLKLDHLPELTSFSRGNYTLDWLSLKYLECKNCPKFSDLPIWLRDQ